MSLINVDNLTFSYQGGYDNIFENVSFQIDTSWRLGFTGRNGRGKTTFLNLLLGKYEYSGKISTDTKFEYFPAEVENKDDFTIDVIRSLCPDCEDWEIFREASLLEVDDDVFYRSFSTLSMGEQTKILLAGLFLNQHYFLLIDEPTNHLDLAARKTLAAYLKKKRGFLLVSHDRALLDECTDHTLAINKTNIEIQKGSFSSWLENKENQDNFEFSQQEKLKKDIARLNESAKKKAEWSNKVESSKYNTKDSGLRPDRGFVGHKAAKMMKRSKSIDARRQNAADEKRKLLKNVETVDDLKIFPLVYHCDRLVELKNISIFYDDKEVCKNISLVLNQGDRISLQGKNGCGKSSILKLICGEKLKTNGEALVASGLKISYLSQDTTGLGGNLSDFAYQNKIDESLFKAILRKLDFERIQFEKDISAFSAGQKKKVLIAKSLCEQAHLYVWDEPLNYIDVFSRMQIESLILKFNPTLLFVEHDQLFTKKIASDIITI